MTLSPIPALAISERAVRRRSCNTHRGIWAGSFLASSSFRWLKELNGPLPLPTVAGNMNGFPSITGSIRRNCNWVRAFAEDPQHVIFRTRSDEPEQLEIARLKREVTKLKAERDILKKAAAYFAKESM